MGQMMRFFCVLVTILTLSPLAHASEAPTADQFKQLSSATLSYWAGVVISQSCGLDHAQADDEFRKALVKWSLTSDQRQQLFRSIIGAAMWVGSGPKKPANWCDQQRSQVRQYYVPLEKLNRDEPYEGR